MRYPASSIHSFKNRCMFRGTSPEVFHQIRLEDVSVDDDCDIRLKDVKFPAAYDIQKRGIVVPGSCPVWKDNALPFRVPPDERVPARRSFWSPLTPLFGVLSIHQTLGETKVQPRIFDLITVRVHLRQLLSFVQGTGSIKYRIDAQVIGKTLLFHRGWDHRVSQSAPSPPRSLGYGRNFERYFTHQTSEKTLRHIQLVTYTFGGLRVMVKYEADACINNLTKKGSEEAKASEETEIREIDGMKVTTLRRNRVTISGANIIELKTKRSGMDQLWFSQTANIYRGIHDGDGLFLDVLKKNVVEDGSLKEWEEKNAESLKKLAKLLGMIRDRLSTSKKKKAALLFFKEEGTNEPVVEFRRFQHPYQPNMLPKQTRDRWFS